MLIKKVIKVLNQRKIPYAIAGGFAVALHGVVRGTVDIDILIPLEEKYLIQTEEALTSLGLVSRIPVDAKNIFQFRLEYIENKNLKVWSFVNPNLPSEIVDVMIIYDLTDFKTEKKNSIFGDVIVVSLEDLIKMKQEAGRPQDIADIKSLEEVLKART